MKETSLLAYLNSEKSRETSSKHILRVLFEHYCAKQSYNLTGFEHDLTYLQIADELFWSNANRVGRRMSELVRAKKVKETGRKIFPIGDEYIVWYFNSRHGL